MATFFLRLLPHDDKPAALAQTVERLRDGEPSPDVHIVDPGFRRGRLPKGHCSFLTWSTHTRQGVLIVPSRCPGAHAFRRAGPRHTQEHGPAFWRRLSPVEILFRSEP